MGVRRRDRLTAPDRGARGGPAGRGGCRALLAALPRHVHHRRRRCADRRGRVRPRAPAAQLARPGAQRRHMARGRVRPRRRPSRMVPPGRAARAARPARRPRRPDRHQHRRLGRASGAVHGRTERRAHRGTVARDRHALPRRPDGARLRPAQRTAAERVAARLPRPARRPVPADHRGRPRGRPAPPDHVRGHPLGHGLRHLHGGVGPGVGPPVPPVLVGTRPAGDPAVRRRGHGPRAAAVHG